MELLREINPLHTNQHLKETHLLKDQNQHQQHELKFDNLTLEEFKLDPALQPKQPLQQAIKLKDQGMPPPSLASLELLRNYGSRFKRLSGQNTSNSRKIVTLALGGCRRKLSPEDIIRLAGASYVQYSTNWYENFCISMHPYGFGLGGLSEEENRDVELAQFLLAAAERVGCQQFERASRSLLHCQWNSCVFGNPVQRVIFHFAQALGERIDKETGRTKGSENNEEMELIQKFQSDPIMAITCHQKIPFNQVLQFSGTQAIMEHVASQTKIHLIDLNVGCGVHCIALMQAIAERHQRPVEFLKLTAVGVTRWKTQLEETGKRLVSFAESLNLPFSYEAIFVTDFTGIKEDQFEIEDDKAVAVYSSYFLRTLVSKPDCLENLRRMIRNIKPSIMIVLEVEANHNSPSFVSRFIEALFFFSPYFDCIETCIKQDNECRMRLETILSHGIRNIVAMEDRERTVRNVKIDVWRRFFARYRMVET